MDAKQTSVKIIGYTRPTTPDGLPDAAASTAVDNSAAAIPTATNPNSSPAHHFCHNSPSDASQLTILSTPNTNIIQKTIANTATSGNVTPKKDMLSAVMLQSIRDKLLLPGFFSELQALAIEHPESENISAMNLVKERYIISAQPSEISPAAAAKTPASYRHLIDLTSSNLKCLDVFTGKEYQCKVINEPVHKVQRAYFQLEQDEELCHSTIYGHKLIRGVHDVVPLSSNRTYIIIAPITEKFDSSGIAMGVYENLHTYIRYQKRIGEVEARTIFHQICQTVQVCHRNGIILRDLKLKRFFFIDEARTKLQYESLEGSMILENPDDDTLCDKIGCPLYTAPELLCPNPTYQGKPADMWSLGVILYTMLIGQYPFYEKANCNLITIIRHGNVQIPNSLSKSVRWLLLALLRKNYEERITAAHIFLTPWLKKQRPFFMYLPVDVEIMEDEVTDDESDYNSSKNIEVLKEIELLKETVAVSTESYDNVGQPLDYTRSTIQMQVSSSVERDTDIELSLDVDMG